MRIIKNIWWLSLIIGIFFLSVGLIAIIDPSILLSFITVIVGIGFLFTGAKDLIVGFSNKKTEKSWWSHLIYSSMNLAIGFLLIIDPQMSLVVTIYYLAFWSIARGIMQIIFGIKLPALKNTTITSGIIIIIMGILLLLYPEEISEVIIVIIGIFISIFGISQIIQASISRQTSTNIKPKIKDAIVVKKTNK